MLFDSHTHINFRDFDQDREELLKKYQKEQIWITNVGTDLASSKSGVVLADKFEKGVYATIGLHPTDSPKSSFDEDSFAELIGPKVVAIGECGLDYFHEKSDEGKQRQKDIFLQQIAFAQKQGLPLVIHCRDAYEDLLQIIKSEYEGQAIIHSFTDSWETAKKFLDLGYYIALNAILIFDKSGNLAEVAKNLPSDRILIETDAPFLAPPPYRGKRNQPDYVRYVVEKIVQIRNESLEKVSELTFENALEVYGIKKPAGI